MRKTMVTLLVMVLVSQPVLVLGGAMAVVNRVGAPALIAADPEMGCRYSGSDLTNHVPIFINGTSDFILQGWPGSGSPGDPYRINRLNITYDIGLIGIRIIETQAYFVISDCFIKQVENLLCIELYNTSHAAIEYTTTITPGEAIHCEYTNNLRILRSVTAAGSSGAATIEYANNTVLQWNLFRSTSSRGLYALDCNDLQSEHNDYVVTGGRSICTYLADCNRASSQYDHSYLGDLGLYVEGGENVTILGFKGEDNDIGIYTIFASRILISACHIANAAQFGIELYLSPNATIDQCVLLDSAGVTGDNAIDIQGSGDTQVTSTQILGSGGRGIYVMSSDRVILDDNRIHETTGDGLYLQNSQNVRVTDNEIVEAGGMGVCFISCTRADVQTNTINNVGSHGVYFSSSNYVNVYGNHIWDAGAACIDMESGIEAYIDLNTVGLSDAGIALLGHTNATVTRNTVSRTVDGGVALVSVSGVAVTYNDITESQYGIQASTVALCDIQQNAIESYWAGIALSDAQDTSVTDNVIEGSGLHGMLLSGCLRLTFSDNDLTECGFVFAEFETEAYYNHTFSDNTVNGRPVFYRWNVSELAVTGSSYGQVILVSCDGATVTGGLFQRCTIAVQAFYCEEIHLVGITSDDNLAGFILRGTFNSTVTGLTMTDGFEGMQVEDCDYLTIESSDVSSSQGVGFMIYYSNDVTIRNVNVEGVQWGVQGSDSPYANVEDSTFRHISMDGILAGSGCLYWNITHCEFFNVSYGMSIQGIYNWLIVDSEFTHCGYAIYVTGSTADNGQVIRCEFYSNGNGIYILSGDYWHIINCTIMWSYNYGIWLSGVTGPEVYGNTIALSGTANGYSSIAQYWDDGVSRGNSWDDYVPPPPYAVGGGPATDRYPSLFLPTEPIIDSPMDVSYPEFSTDNYITWRPFDDYLRNWTVEIDGLAWASGAWDFESITVNIDGLSYGTHVVVVTVWDVDQNSVTNEVTVHVYDDVGPTLSHLTNTEAFVGGSGQALTWDVSDRHPGSYRILRNGEEVSSGTWVNGNISTSLDGFALGVYEYDIRVYDADGNGAHDQVIVNVLEDITWPSLDSPADIVFIVGTTDNYVTWTPDDDHPKNYEVAQDGVVVESGTWSGSRILFNLDGLSVGNYNFTLTVYDGAGHSASDSVGVSVHPYEGYVEPGAFDLMTLAIAGAAIGGVVVVIALVYYFRKRGK